MENKLSSKKQNEKVYVIINNTNNNICKKIKTKSKNNKKIKKTKKTKKTNNNNLKPINAFKPILVKKIYKTDDEWKAQLGEETYKIAREKGTGLRKMSNDYDTKIGIYNCVCCNLPLFTSITKYNSGSGCPSFYMPISNYNIKTEIDISGGMNRTSVECSRCNCHLGHLFNDGPQPTGLRYCMNSESLTFMECK
jgi:peptide-methionine (R)-S-oxide reductase